MNINKFTNNIDDAPLHSSGFADVAHGTRIGATSSQSFTQRLHIERNRQSVGRYHDSMLANGRHHGLQYERLSSSATPSSRPGTSASQSRQSSSSRFGGQRPTGGLISDVSRPVARTNFTEPPSRGYNPYQ